MPPHLGLRSLHHSAKNPILFGQRLAELINTAVQSTMLFSILKVQWDLSDTILTNIKNKNVLSENCNIQHRVQKILKSIYLAQNLLLLKNFKIVYYFLLNFLFLNVLQKDFFGTCRNEQQFHR